jgi:hypothetical protein
LSRELAYERVLHTLDTGLPLKMKKKIHINQHIIRSNKKLDKNDPVITIKTSKTNTYAKEIEILGRSKVIYSPDKPLSCGAKVWIETEADVVLEDGRVL